MGTDQKIFCLLAPTASGKKAVAQSICEKLNAEIISLDSMKIYKGMDIGTAKPSQEEIKKYKYHLIDIIRPNEDYNVARFVKSCESVINDIHNRGLNPLLLVGTPLYLRSLLYGIFESPPTDKDIRTRLEQVANEKGVSFLHNKLQKVDSERASKIHPNDKKRIIRALEVQELTGSKISSLQTHFACGKPKTPPRYETILVGLKWAREDLLNRIDNRVNKMFESGLVDEVKLLWQKEQFNRQTMEAIAYKEVIQLLKSEITLEEAKALTKKRTHYLAKKQMTWFRSFADVQWVDIKSDSKIDEAAKKVMDILSRF